MAALIGDRFLGRDAGVALDLATGACVRVRIEPCGTRTEQQKWTDACTRAQAEGALVDFGFIGLTHRFEARRHAGAVPSPACARSTDAVVEWLEETNPSSSRILYVTELPDARAVR